MISTSKRPVSRVNTSSGETFKDDDPTLGVNGGCGGIAGELGIEVWAAGGSTGGHVGAPRTILTTAVRIVGADSTVRLSSSEAAEVFASFRASLLVITLLCVVFSAEIVTVSATLAASAKTLTLEMSIDISLANVVAT